MFFAKTFGCTRFIWNKMFADKQEHYKKHKESIFPTPAQYKSEYPFLKEVDSLALPNAQQDLKTAYTRFFKGVSRFPKFKKKNTYPILQDKQPRWSYSS